MKSHSEVIELAKMEALETARELGSHLTSAQIIAAIGEIDEAATAWLADRESCASEYRCLVISEYNDLVQ